MKPKILIVDDEPLTRNAMARALGGAYDCHTAADGDLALADLAANPDTAVLLTDYKMPGMNGVELIRKAKAAHPELGAILITAFGEIELAVEAMKQGADDFLTKPITDLDQLEFRVAQTIRTPAAPEPEKPAKAFSGKDFESFTGASPAMQRVYALIRKVAPSDATVLLGGPSGSGKELAARAIHALSRRADKPFIAVECSAFSGDLLKSELFGYEPGTFTGGLKDGKSGCFEDAAGGTLFLDEIGEIDMPTQTALLRTLETKSVRRLGGSREKRVDFRLIAATNRDLAQMVVDGTFREDLYYRLNVIGIRLPALRDRPGDVPLLVARFIREFSAANGNRVKGIEPEALKILENGAWPGNVRQLRNVIERMVVLASGERLTVDDIPEEIAAANAAPRTESAPQTPRSDAAASAPATLADAERDRIVAALAECRGNKSRAAEVLGISRRTIHRKLKEWGIG